MEHNHFYTTWTASIKPSMCGLTDVTPLNPGGSI